MTKSRKEEIRKYYAVYGGKNERNPPFNVGDVLKQRYTTDSDGNLIDGRELMEFVGMKGIVMLLKSLNQYAADNADILSDIVLKDAKKAGWRGEIGSITQLHYMYADRFDVIK